MRSVAQLILFVLLAFAAASLGALFPPGGWYVDLAKPGWTPPAWVFGPVWTVLYLMIGVAGWLLWRARDGSRRALVLWGAQLALNAAWSPVFFGLQSPGTALVVIALLFVAILATIRAAFDLRPAAAWLLVPYAAWVAFASALNAAIWALN